MTSDHVLYGWRLRSAFPLPQLPLWRGDPAREPDIVIEAGDVPDRLPDLVRQTPFVQVSADGRVLSTAAHVGTCLLEGGRRVTVSTSLPSDAPDLPSMLLGSLSGFLCHQRGMLPMHASCLAFEGRAVAFAAPSGTGKSTIAATLLRQGHRMLADDITVVDPSSGSGVQVMPAFPQQKLWRDTLDGLGLTPGRRLRLDGSIEKFEHRVPGQFQAEPLPLAAVCHLELADGRNGAVLERLSGMRAVEVLRSNIYRFGVGAALNGKQRLIEQVSALANAVPQFRLRRPDGLGRLEALTARLPAMLREEGILP